MSKEKKTHWERHHDKLLALENLLTEWQDNGGPAELMDKTEELLKLREKKCSQCSRMCSFTAHFCRGCGGML